MKAPNTVVSLRRFAKRDTPASQARSACEHQRPAAALGVRTIEARPEVRPIDLPRRARAATISHVLLARPPLLTRKRPSSRRWFGHAATNPRICSARQLLDEARLSDAGLAGHEDHVALPANAASRSASSARSSWSLPTKMPISVARILRCAHVDERGSRLIDEARSCQGAKRRGAAIRRRNADDSSGHCFFRCSGVGHGDHAIEQRAHQVEQVIEPVK